MQWTFEPGHTAAEFRARHMMVTWVRGAFKNVRGTMHFDPGHPENASFEASADARELWSGEPERDAHLRSADFLDVENFPQLTLRSESVQLLGPNDAEVRAQITIRGVTRPLVLRVTFLGTWETPWWEDGVDRGPKLRAGFVARGRLNRHDFGVSWNPRLARGGLVVGAEVEITLDAEAILDEV
jgi:polyisoprenoid-binding protein YceI